ncbi:hypothetical protein ACWF94_00015 [Streptomyces sp. NPDC055078]
MNPTPARTADSHGDAVRAVATAFRSRGQWATAQPAEPRTAGTADTAEPITVVLENVLPLSLAGAPAVPLPSDLAARTLERALRAQDIRARVTLADWPRNSPRITLSSPGDAHRLADLVWAEMPQPYQAAHHLRTALGALEIKTSGPQVRNDGIDIGSMSAEHALALLTLLGGNPPPHLRPANARHLDGIVRRLRYRLRLVLPGIQVTARPACGTCRASRPHQVVIGTAALDHIAALTALLNAAAPTCPSTPPATTGTRPSR